MKDRREDRLTSSRSSGQLSFKSINCLKEFTTLPTLEKKKKKTYLNPMLCLAQLISRLRILISNHLKNN